MECLGLHNKPKAEVHPGHKLTGPKEEEEVARKTDGTDKRTGKGTGAGISQIRTVATKMTKMCQIGQRSVATVFANRLWPLLSSPTQHISVLDVALDKTCYFRESSHKVSPVTP
jgi:hypothetical protein